MTKLLAWTKRQTSGTYTTRLAAAKQATTDLGYVVTEFNLAFVEKEFTGSVLRICKRAERADKKKSSPKDIELLKLSERIAVLEETIAKMQKDFY